MPYYLYLAIALAIAGSSAAGGWQLHGWKASHDNEARLEQEAHDAKRRSEVAITAAAAYEADKAAQRPRTIIVTREVTNAIQADPDCSQRALPPGLRDALKRAAADADQPLADGPMPTASAAGAFELGRPGAGLLGGVAGAGRLSGQTQATR